MKLSAMTGEELRTSLCLLAPPLCAILQDERTQHLLDSIMDPSVPLCSLAARVIGQGVPLLLQDHFEDTCTVLTLLTDRTPEQLAAMDAPALLHLIRSVWDEDLSAFFASAGTAHRVKSSVK